MRRFLLFYFCLIITLGLISRGQGSSSQQSELFERAPRVIAHKSIHSQPNNLIVGNEWTVSYFLINIGDAKAIDVEVTDRWDPKYFQGVHNIDSIHGNVRFTIPALDIRKSQSFNVTLIPKAEGTYTSFRARIKYYNGGVHLQDDEEYDEEDLLVGHSSSPDQLNVISSDEYILSTSSHLLVWVGFVTAIFASVAVPAITWRMQASRLSELVKTGPRSEK
jgi:hypothetical protein